MIRLARRNTQQQTPFGEGAVMESSFHVPTTWSRIISVYVAFVLLVLIPETYQAPAPVLYTDQDNVLILNQSNFENLIYNKDRAFIIEFYNSYCGHCQRYAPTWISFAKDIKHWGTVVAPAVIDCSVSINLQICQNYDIPAFPTVKHFWTHLTAKDLGVTVPHRADVKHNLLDFLTQNAQEKGSPNHWPMILPISGTSLAGIWKDLPKEISSFYLVIEESDSYIGREVILDFSGTDARILRMEDTSATQINDMPHIPNYPALVLLSRNASPKILLSATSKRDPRYAFRTAIEGGTGIILDPSSNTGGNKSEDKDDDQKNNSAKTNTTLPVQMVDLENAVHNILIHEVPLKKELTGTKLSAFKSFLAALTKTFPGRVQVMNFLQNLYSWVLQQGQVINSNEMLNFILGSQTPDAFLPDMTDWVGCKGSSPKYRGYTCSLWTLFHSMTVRAYNNYLTGEASHPQQVLQAIHNYVYNFFGCTECAEHFHSMALNLESETQHPNDTVLWLWRGHNKVNKRLKGDATEDPAHRKIQFPPESLCKQCRKEADSQDPAWDTEMVLKFLMNYYGQAQISLDGVLPFNSNLTRQRRTESNKSPSVGWNFRYFSGLDISLCVLLYVFSVVLLTVVFLVFRFRRHRLKRKNGYSVRQLP